MGALDEHRPMPYPSVKRAKRRAKEMGWLAACWIGKLVRRAAVTVNFPSYAALAAVIVAGFLLFTVPGGGGGWTAFIFGSAVTSGVYAWMYKRTEPEGSYRRGREAGDREARTAVLSTFSDDPVVDLDAVQSAQPRKPTRRGSGYGAA